MPGADLPRFRSISQKAVYGTEGSPPDVNRHCSHAPEHPCLAFFFDIHDSEEFTPNCEGLDLDDLEAAKAEAKKTLPEIVKDEMLDGDRRDFTVDVKNAAGQLVWRVTLSLVVESPSQGSTENS